MEPIIKLIKATVAASVIPVAGGSVGGVASAVLSVHCDKLEFIYQVKGEVWSLHPLEYQMHTYILLLYFSHIFYYLYFSH